MDRFTECLDRQFTQLNLGWTELIAALSPGLLYRQPPRESNSFPLYSCGEQILRGAGAVEQTFGGITTNLWDDPIEWTLPETLPTPESVAAYLAEVETTRNHGFELFRTDEDLLKEVMAPLGKTQLLTLLLDTLVRAGHHQAGAWEIFKRLRAEERIESSSVAGNFAR